MGGGGSVTITVGSPSVERGGERLHERGGERVGERGGGAKNEDGGDTHSDGRCEGDGGIVTRVGRATSPLPLPNPPAAARASSAAGMSRS